MKKIDKKEKRKGNGRGKGKENRQVIFLNSISYRRLDNLDADLLQRCQHPMVF